MSLFLGHPLYFRQQILKASLKWLNGLNKIRSETVHYSKMEGIVKTLVHFIS